MTPIFLTSFSFRIAVTTDRKHPTRKAVVYPYLQTEGTLKSLGDKCYVYHLLSRLGFWSTQYNYGFPKGLNYYPGTEQTKGEIKVIHWAMTYCCYTK